MSQLSLLQKLVSNALEVVDLKLIRSPDDIDNDNIIFHPMYAHQIFGENEMIFGYKDLQIHLYYTAASLDLYLGIKYTYRVDDFSKEGLKADDVMSEISKLITSGVYYTNIDEFRLKLAKDDSFMPMGKRVHTFTCEAPAGTHNNGAAKQRTFEFYKCTVDTPNFTKFHAKLQTFILWFVDAASYIDEDDPKWQFFVCFEKYKNSEGKTMYATVGYSTIYHFYAYPRMIRPRISQMLILPPFQRCGLGTEMIRVIYRNYQNDPNVRDITVEDPSSEFRRIRNYVDVGLCKTLPSFASETIANGFNERMAKEACEHFKINSRQCRIVYEILRLKYTNTQNEREYANYRIDVKKRLNKTYHQQMLDIKKLEKAGLDSQWMWAGITPLSERFEQLKDEFKEIVEEYEQILKRFE